MNRIIATINICTRISRSNVDGVRKGGGGEKQQDKAEGIGAWRRESYVRAIGYRRIEEKEGGKKGGKGGE